MAWFGHLEEIDYHGSLLPFGAGGSSPFRGDPDEEAAREELKRREREREFYRQQDHDMGEDVDSPSAPNDNDDDK